MAICQLMILDFMWGHGKSGYGRYDLIVGLHYVQDLMSEGYVTEPFHGYNLENFEQWAKTKLEALQDQREEKK